MSMPAAARPWTVDEVRAMQDEHGNEIKEAGPGTPVLVLGWQSLPEAGDEFRSLDSEAAECFTPHTQPTACGRSTRI